MTERATFSLEADNLAFLNMAGGTNKSAYINQLLKKEKLKTLEEAIFHANQEEADIQYQKELLVWNVTLLDGLNESI